ncbi:type VI secretion system ATPase TssH [Thalassomonas actiniarum]|uniref:Type VI secretion system ATPase TssH n=1 Tax=Thalassomonas actiniarum TaxID=485447 RepID=A0AAE9YW40_9GAMM|nr:type VI secretion system ATPase TssH [Thalassomonas actiniarum]WDE01444.1 type VI secretion system ATPase TssH [Thalassomonas actiniarum]
MAEISRISLFGKLNSLAFKAVESATVFCKLRGNPYVEISHWLHQILQLDDSDLHRIIRHYQLDLATLLKALTQSLDQLPRGASSISDFSHFLELAIERGWVYSSLVYQQSHIRTGTLLVAMLKTPELKNTLCAISPQFARINAESLSDELEDIIQASCEQQLSANDISDQLRQAGQPGEASSALPPDSSATLGEGEALSRFTTDLTEQAKQGSLDAIVGRDEEIRQLIDILMRRRQNNPILTGEAGVGKTAVVEGFAHRLNKGDVPPKLLGVRLKLLDIGLLQAGASMKGEFEHRLKQVIAEVQSSPVPIILFIDEAHTLIGAGGSAGTSDAANLLKPALARGTLKTIAATTWAEYKKHIEKDPALTRRFQVVKVAEPDEAKAVIMLRNLTRLLQEHHRVDILDEAVEAAVKLSARYISARQLPDKAVSLLDTACARVAISQHATPPQLEDSQRQIEQLNLEQHILTEETRLGHAHAKKLAAVDKALAQQTSLAAELNKRWQQEIDLVEEITACKQELCEHIPGPAPNPDKEQTTTETAHKQKQKKDKKHTALSKKLTLAQTALQTLQREEPLILPAVDYQAVASVVAGWTGIPVGKMVKDEVENILKLSEILGRRVIGQDHAMEMISKRIQTARAGLDNPNKPIGVFMLCGPSGVGKTETALALAEAMYGGEHNLITINMSEFQEAHTVSTLKGAPPGYVGYGEGGILTEAVRRKPYSVVLLDEIEKAHPDVHEIFFQVFDKGIMEDSEGRLIDFKNTLILLTSNVGSELITGLCRDPALMPAPQGMNQALRAPLLKVFPPALLGRLVTIPFYPLSADMLAAIARLQLERIKKRVALEHQVPFNYDDKVIALIVSRCAELESGGRMIDDILTNSLLPAISRHYLNSLLEGKVVKQISVKVKDNEFIYNYQ